MNNKTYRRAVIRANQSEDIAWETCSEPLNLKVDQGAVGGYVEHVPYVLNQEYHTRASMLVNENGIMESLPVNLIAISMTGIHILGDVVVYDRKLEEIEAMFETSER